MSNLNKSHLHLVSQNLMPQDIERQKFDHKSSWSGLHLVNPGLPANPGPESYSSESSFHLDAEKSSHEILLLEMAGIASLVTYIVWARSKNLVSEKFINYSTGGI